MSEPLPRITAASVPPCTSNVPDDVSVPVVIVPPVSCTDGTVSDFESRSSEPPETRTCCMLVNVAPRRRAPLVTSRLPIARSDDSVAGVPDTVVVPANRNVLAGSIVPEPLSTFVLVPPVATSTRPGPMFVVSVVVPEVAKLNPRDLIVPAVPVRCQIVLVAVPLVTPVVPLNFVGVQTPPADEKSSV